MKSIDFNYYYKQRLDAYNSYDKIIDGFPCGFGRTTQWTKILCENGKNTISLLNNHWLQYESYIGITNGSFNIENYIRLIDLYGKFKIVDPEIQHNLGYPPCFCNMYESAKNLFNLFRIGCLPIEWCEKLCPYNFKCEYELKKDECWDKRFVKDNKMFLLPKAYNNTGLVHKLQKYYKDNNFFYDENPFNYLTSDITFGYEHLSRFQQFIYRTLLSLDKTLLSFIKDFSPIVNEMKNSINLSKKITGDERYTNLYDSILTLLESYDIESLMRKFNKIRHTIYNNRKSIKFYKNFYNLFVPFEELLKSIDGTKEIFEGMKNMMVSENTNSFSYIIDNTKLINENIELSKKFIFGSGFFYIEDIINKLYPEFDDYISLKLDEHFYPMKETYLFKSAAYKKNYFYSCGVIKKPFHSVAKLVKDIIDHILTDEKILIVLFKQGVKELTRKYFPKDEYSNIFMEYWYNLEGKNIYLDCTSIILFGCAGKPSRLDEIVSQMLGIDIKIVQYHSMIEEMYQAVGRIRPDLFKFLKRAFFITNIKIPQIKEYIVFDTIEDLMIIPYLGTKIEGASSEEILKEVYHDRVTIKTVRKKMKILFENEKIKYYKKSSGVGRPALIWQIK